jgi:hypothetical protein
LRKRIALKSSEKLRSRLVADSKQEKEKERSTKNAWDRDTELPNSEARQKASNNRTEFEGSKPKSPDEITGSESQEESQIRMILQSIPGPFNRCRHSTLPP